MLFNSTTFAAFLLIVYVGYTLLMNRLRLQNLFLLAASLVFYSWWDWRFTVLLLASTGLSYLCALKIDEGRERRRFWLLVAVIINVGALAFFKYFNFFQENLIALLSDFGFTRLDPVLNVLLPIGISFFTFHNLSYVMDVYRGNYKAERNFNVYALYLTFFPQLIAGPIARANHMLPQFSNPRRLDAQQTLDGLTLIAWGLFKKTVVADRLAGYVNPVFDNYTDYPGFGMTFAVLAFTFQIYCDFSAYSDIARGVAKLFGLELMLNFNLPYISRSPREFWRRWHISLSTCIRDYLYRPLGGNRGTDLLIARNLMLTMLIGGLWHGAAWNFIAWGGYHGLLLTGQHLFERAAKRHPSAMAMPPVLGMAVVPLQIGAMFILTMLGWVLFRGESMELIGYVLTHLGFAGIDAFRPQLVMLAAFVAILAVVDGYFCRRVESGVAERVPVLTATLLLASLTIAMMVYAIRIPTEFIYFQF